MPWGQVEIGGNGFGGGGAQKRERAEQNVASASSIAHSIWFGQ
jgi:hypothetical protein